MSGHKRRFDGAQAGLHERTCAEPGLSRQDFRCFAFTAIAAAAVRFSTPSFE
jgi:hypothetical protein